MNFVDQNEHILYRHINPSVTYTVCDGISRSVIYYSRASIVLECGSFAYRFSREEDTIFVINYIGFLRA
jgi:hypothetical protein